MSTAHALYARWITELWNGRPIASEIATDDFVGHWPDREVHGPDGLAQIIAQTRNMLSDLSFAIDVGPLSEGELVAGRWAGTGRGPDGPVSFTGTTSFAWPLTVNGSPSTGRALRRAEGPPARARGKCH